MSIPLGKLEKMLILGYDSASDAADKGKLGAAKTYEVLINPENYSVHHANEHSCCDQGQGTSGQELIYTRTLPQVMDFSFLFDSSGLADMKPALSITKKIEDFRDILFKYEGKVHMPRDIKLVWGDGLVFTCKATDLTVEYKLFNTAGMPIRAIAKAKFKGSIEEKKRAALENKSSPDLTHTRKVKAGDTLPLMCLSIYGDPGYYLQVAEANGIGNFRRLVPGMEIVFPPIDKIVN